jgi:hypothetical protein
LRLLACYASVVGIATKILPCASNRKDIFGQVKNDTLLLFKRKSKFQWFWKPLFPLKTLTNHSNEKEQLANEAVNTLYAAGLDDVAHIREGEFNNSVSLGYFISQSNATTHRDKIREMGFPAEFRIQRQDESRFWVDYEQQTGVEYASRVLAGFVPSELHMPTSCAQPVDSLVQASTDL